MNIRQITTQKMLFVAVLCFALVTPIVHAAQTVTVKDVLGRTVTAPHNPKRIANLGGGLRVVTYLQATDKVVGVEDIEKRRPDFVYSRPYRAAHPEFAKLPRVGSGGASAGSAKPDYEALLVVQPEVIFMTTTNRSLADDAQKTLGIPVVVLNTSEAAGSFTKPLYQSLRITGKILAKEQRAEAVIQFIEGIRSDLRQRTRGLKPRPAYVGGVCHKGVHGIDGSRTKYLPLVWAGADNLAARFPGNEFGHVKLDREALLKLNPEVLFVDSCGWSLIKGDMAKRPEFYRSLQAFRNQKAYRLFPYVAYYSNIDTAMLDAYAVGKLLYPKQFEDINLIKKADEIYEFMVGKSVYKGMQRAYGKLGEVVPLVQ